MVARQACADSGQRHFGVFLGQIHNHLACVGDFAFARFREDGVGLYLIMRCHALSDHLKVDGAPMHADYVGHHYAGQIDVDFAVEHCGVGKQ